MGVAVAWVKAHIGMDGNEEVDKAARQCAEKKETLIPSIQTPIPKNILKDIIDTAIRVKWQQTWTFATQYKHTKHFLSGPDKNKSKKILCRQTT